MNVHYVTVAEMPFDLPKAQETRDPIPAHDDFIARFGDLKVVPNTYIPAYDNGQEYFVVWPDSFYIYCMFKRQWRKVVEGDDDYKLIVKCMGKTKKCGCVDASDEECECETGTEDESVEDA